MTDADARRIYDEAQIGGALTLGRRPGVLVVDLQTGFTSPDGPVGAELSGAVLSTRRLLDTARAFAVPVVFTVIAYGSPAEAGVWLQKMPGLGALRADGPWVQVDPRLGHRDDEPLIVKKGASALSGTNVAAIFTAARVDTVILTGATTSGCVRASAVDLMQAGFPVLVPRECCGDRAQGPHEANLFDMASKYADVVALDDALAYLRESVGDGAARR